MNSGRRLFVFVYLMLSLRGAAAVPDLASDAAALLAFRAAVAPRRLRWAPTASPCSWRGIVCGGGGERVTELHLPGAGLRGRVPEATLGNLTALRTLSLRLNAITAPLPGDVAALSAELLTLSLRGNRISGEFPPPILALHRLRRLDLAGNLLSGPIPPGLDLPSLVSFNVSCNPLLTDPPGTPSHAAERIPRHRSLRRPTSPVP